jgi:hypothetical protein
MKLTLIGAAAVAAAAFVTPALAQGPGNPYADGGYWRNGNAMVSDHAMQSTETERYRYHGGPKSND